jgi:hypothetical protein
VQVSQTSDIVCSEQDRENTIRPFLCCWNLTFGEVSLLTIMLFGQARYGMSWCCALAAGMKDFKLYANIYITLIRGQDRLYREYLKWRRPGGPFNPKEYFFDTSPAHLSVIRDPIYEVIQMRVRDDIYDLSTKCTVLITCRSQIKVQR